MDKLTPVVVLQRVNAVRDVAGDAESAHCAEDELWRDVLVAIRDGRASDARECARIALTTFEIDFARWYA